MRNTFAVVTGLVTTAAILSVDITPASAQIEELIVTARKKEESVQDVPIAVQAFDTEMIEKYAATNLNEIVEMSNQVLAFGQASGNGGVFFIRGQGTGSLDPGLESSVVINIDGVQVDRGHIHRQAFFDMRNVQVLKGPQTLFYGKNSPAGVIALESAGPSDVFEASIQLGYEFEAEEVVGEVVVSGPITDTFGARLAYRGTDMDGYLDNNARPVSHAGEIFPDEPYDFPGGASDTVGGDESNTLRLTLDWAPTESFDAVVKILYSDLETDNFASIENISCSGPLPITFTLPGPVGLGTLGPAVGTADSAGDCKLDGKLSHGSLPAELAATYPGAGGGGSLRRLRKLADQPRSLVGYRRLRTQQRDGVLRLRLHPLGQLRRHQFHPVHGDPTGKPDHLVPGAQAGLTIQRPGELHGGRLL